MRSEDFQETTRDDPNRLLGVPLWGSGLPRRGREPQGDNPGNPKEASRRRGAQVLINTPKRMNSSLRRNVHAVEARSPS